MGPTTIVSVLSALMLMPLGKAFPTSSLTSFEEPISDPNFGPKPGFSSLYSNYTGIAAPFPANITEPIPATMAGNPLPDDQLWQNLLAAEWIIFSFYQTAVETFNASSFAALSMPNNTYQRITEIRDNEAGHLRIFQDQISPSTVKPGACQYSFPLGDDPATFLALSTLIEVASMAFLTGLVQEAVEKKTRGALAAVSHTETRHEVWSLLEIWGVDPFAGPSDTVFPYAHQILDLTNRFVVPGSCPAANPPFPNPSQHLPRISVAAGTKSVAVGSTVQLSFPDPTNQPRFKPSVEYWAVFYHGVNVVSKLVSTADWPKAAIYVTIPAELESKGVVVMVLAKKEGAPSSETVVAGPVFFLQQPAELGIAVM